MPDFEAMTDKELRVFRSWCNAEMIRIREEMREAGRVLERKRAEADRAEYERVLAEYGADAVAAASKIITAPPAAADSSSPQIGV